MPAEEQQEQYKRINQFSKLNKLAVTINNANPESKKMTPIDLNDHEVFTFLKRLQDDDVQYMLVGGFAVAFYGHIRATIDLDLWIKDSDANIEKFKLALTACGVEGLEHVKNLELIAGFTQFAIGESGFVIDPMKSLKAFSAFDFDRCYTAASVGEFNGLHFKVISSSDLLQEKESINRPKDQGDIEYLRTYNRMKQK